MEAPKPLVLTHNAEIPQYVAIVLDKVDPVYQNEARNAFNRYNREQYSTKGFTVNNQSVSDDIKLVLIGTFPNANEAISYIDKTKKLAVSEIIPVACRQIFIHYPHRQQPSGVDEYQRCERS